MPSVLFAADGIAPSARRGTDHLTETSSRRPGTNTPQRNQVPHAALPNGGARLLPAVSHTDTEEATMSPAQREPHGTGTHDRTRERPVVAHQARRGLFVLWFVATALMLLGAYGLSYVLEPERIGMVQTAVVLPIVTGTLVFVSLGWLAWIVFGPARHQPPKQGLER